MILTNSLVQNIKRLYTNSKVVALSSPELFDIAKYQESVDDVIIWDRKNKHKGIFATLKFVFNFPYKNIYACFPIYGMDRPALLSFLLNPKYIVCKIQTFFSHLRRMKYPLIQNNQSMQERFTQLLTGITNEKLTNVSIKYNIPDSINSNVINNIKNDDYTVLVAQGSKQIKDMPFELACEIIEKMPDTKFVYIGQGSTVKEFSEKISKKGYTNLIDLSNKTTPLEAAAIIKNAKGIITVDTGWMHIACAVGTPFVAMFFASGAELFIPNDEMYNCKVLNKDITSDNVIDSYNVLLNIKK